MNEWDFSGLLNQLPDDMIVSAYTSPHQEHAAVSADDDMYPSAMPQAKAVYSDPLPEAHAPVKDLNEYEKQSTGSTLLPILMTAGCTAACIAGMILLIRPFVKADFPDDVTIQSNTQNIAITELTEAQPDETALSTSPVTQAGTETAGQTVTGTTTAGRHAADTTAPVSTDTAAQTAGTTHTEPTAAVTTAAATGTVLSAAEVFTTATVSAKNNRTTLAAMESTAVITTEPVIYEMGDVNMDGRITEEDAKLVQEEYLLYTVMGNGKHILTDEQLALADVSPLAGYVTPTGITAIDAWYISALAILREMGFEEATFENLEDYRIYLQPNEMPGTEP